MRLMPHVRGASEILSEAPGTGFEAPTAPAYAPSPADDDWEEPEEDRAMYEAYDAQMRALEEANR